MDVEEDEEVPTLEETKPKLKVPITIVTGKIDRLRVLRTN